jgi:hypothetical protein
MPCCESVRIVSVAVAQRRQQFVKVGGKETLLWRRAQVAGQAIDDDGGDSAIHRPITMFVNCPPETSALSICRSVKLPSATSG